MLSIGTQYLRNVYVSWIVIALRVSITFFFVPYITSVLGGERYGIWVILFQVIGYFSLLDGGLTSALTRYVSKHLRGRDFGAINRVLSSATALYLVVGLLVLLAAWLSIDFLFDQFRIDQPDIAQEARTALMLLAVFMAFGFWMLPFGNSLQAFQRTDLSNVLDIGLELVRAAVMVWLLAHGHGLVALAWTVLALSLARNVIGIFVLKRLHPEIRFGLGGCDREATRELLNYSRVSLGITACWLVILHTDSILLGLLSSTAAAGIYHPGAQLIQHLRLLIHAVGGPLTPAISHLEAGSDPGMVREIYLKGVKYTAFLTTLIATAIFFYAEPFVALWLDPQFAQAGRVMSILAVGAAISLPQTIGEAVLFGIGKHRYLLRFLVIEAVVKLVLAMLLIERYGLIGMALAATIPQVVLYLAIYPLCMRSAIGVGPVEILRPQLSSTLLAAIVTGLGSLAMIFLLAPQGWLALVINVAAVSVITIGLGWMMVLDPADRTRIIAAIRRRK